MKAVQIVNPSEIKVVELEKPTVGAGEVLVRIKYVGFCGSDLNTFLGKNPMVKFRPQDMLLVYALMNILLCGAVMIWGGMIGLYAMLAISFFMSIMYPTQFSLALKGLGNQTKSGSAFLVMAIVGNACLPQLTAYFMHANEHIYYMAYCVPMICFVFCAYYGWKGYKVID